MGHSYVTVQWNRQKKIYDGLLALGVVLYLASFIVLGAILHPNATAETHLIRAFGTGALLLLHIILSIGPLARLDKRFLPLLYNRRHMGVTMFILAFVHGGFSLVQFHALGNRNPLVSLFLSNTNYFSVADFPFQTLGFFALLILFLMAATSHDFWLKNLSAPIWKSLHMLVYIAYALIIVHVVLGALQSEPSLLLSGLLAAGFIWILAIHLIAGFKEKALDEDKAAPGQDFIDIGPASDIPENRAKIVTLGGERVAIFKYDGKVSALSNACQHQNGPLGEGCLIKGKIVCPWHGYEYKPESGQSPAPFTEKVPTYQVKVKEGRVFVNPNANPPGTPVEPAKI